MANPIMQYKIGLIYHFFSYGPDRFSKVLKCVI